MTKNLMIDEKGNEYGEWVDAPVNVSGKVAVGQKWKEKSCDHIVTITEISKDFATCTMVAFESECCLSSSPLEMFLNDFEPVSQGVKHDSGKLRMSLLPIGPLTEVLTILEFGAVKYAPDNWRYVVNARTRYFDAAQRHIMAWWQGEQTDSESGKHHLAHAVCCLMFLMWFDLVGDTND